MDENAAQQATRSYAETIPPFEGRRWEDRDWSALRFNGGWLMHPQGEDLAWRTGVICLVIMDDGQVIKESSSLPPRMLVEKYELDE